MFGNEPLFSVGGPWFGGFIIFIILIFAAVMVIITNDK